MCCGVIVVMLHTGLSHVTKLDDSLLPRAQALHDFTATDSQRLSFNVRLPTAQNYSFCIYTTSECVQMCGVSVGQSVCIQTGDILNLLEKIDNDWYSGENTRTGSFGDFPASSVKIIVPLP